MRKRSSNSTTTGLILAVVGAGIAFYGWNKSQSVKYQIKGVFKGGMPEDVLLMMVAGGVLAAVGLILVLKGRR